MISDLSGCLLGKKMPFTTFIKIGPNGVIPKRTEPDVGYDLTLVSLKDKSKFTSSKDTYSWGDDVELYGTEIYITPETDDIYFEIFPRSSMSKSPYILANSVGIVDPSYTGELLVALRKIDATKPSLTLPARIVQLVPRQRFSVSFKEVDELPCSSRGSGGFGSTGK